MDDARQRAFLDLEDGGLAALMEEWGYPRFHASQVDRWVFDRFATDFSVMTDLPEDLRSRLASALSILQAERIAVSSASGGTRKQLLRWRDGATTETVMIPSETGQRRTVCVSTQVGCDVGCRFCASGIGGSLRNLTVGEVVEQAVREAGSLASEGERLSHVVFMGMGEPLANYRVTVEAVRRISSSLGIGRRRITVSTVGLPRQIRKLAGEDLQATLALSLHAPDADLRASLIPWAEAIDLDEVLAACLHYYETTGREVTLEYCLLAGVNDRPEHARALARIARDLRAHVNLMMYNPVAGLAFERPRREATLDFLSRLRAAGANAHLRHSRGLETDAACGQLRRRLG